MRFDSLRDSNEFKTCRQGFFLFSVVSPEERARAIKSQFDGTKSIEFAPPEVSTVHLVMFLFDFSYAVNGGGFSNMSNVCLYVTKQAIVHTFVSLIKSHLI